METLDCTVELYLRNRMSDIRLVALGPPSSGKTSIIKRFLFNTFSDKYKPTIEDLFSKEFILNGVKIKVDILDTAGRVEFPAMRRLCISNASAFLFVYSLDPNATNGASGASGGGDFSEIRECFEEVKGIRGNVALAGLPIVFVGNKLDLICRHELAVGMGPKGSRSGSGGGSGGDLSTRTSEFPASLVGDTGFTLDWIEGIEDMQ
ncbi:unnamed protein product [Allacma fusca]|uniref:Uncharacterized protein n=1 Tax=Allacma fusca TaxID=39272 RepID=A0A8J2JHI5_9HEXA|nr:unnamed protein product [Allacma fusca]